MAIIKVIELMASSGTSWEDAAQQAVNHAAKSLRNIRSVYIKEQSAEVENNKVVQYRITAKISFQLDDSE
jgi:flavin-binding protein dodecin